MAAYIGLFSNEKDDIRVSWTDSSETLTHSWMTIKSKEAEITIHFDNRITSREDALRAFTEGMQ